MEAVEEKEYVEAVGGKQRVEALVDGRSRQPVM